MSDPFDWAPDDWSTIERELWEPFEEALDDPAAQALFNEAYFEPGVWDKDQISAIREELHNYMMDNYDIDFEAVFDWEAWREMYDGG